MSDRDLQRLQPVSSTGPRDRYLMDSPATPATSSKTQKNASPKVDTTFFDPIQAFDENEERRLTLNKSKRAAISSRNNIKIEARLRPVGDQRVLRQNKKKQRSAKGKQVVNKKGKLHKKNNHKQKRSLAFKKNVSQAVDMAKQQIAPQVAQQQQLPATVINQPLNVQNPQFQVPLQQGVSFVNQAQNIDNRNLNIIMNTDTVNDPTSLANNDQMQLIQGLINNAGSKKKVILKPSELTLLQSIAAQSPPVSQQERDQAIAAGARACQGTEQRNIFFNIINQINSGAINQKLVASVAALAAIRMAKSPKAEYSLKIKTEKGRLAAAEATYSLGVTQKNERSDNVLKLVDLVDIALNDIGTGMSSKIRMLNAMLLKKFNSNDMDVLLFDAH